MTAFRFVFEEAHESSKNNFLPVLIIKPQRKLQPDTPQERCKGYALSLFDTQHNSEKRYAKLKQRYRDIDKTLVQEGRSQEAEGRRQESL